MSFIPQNIDVKQFVTDEPQQKEEEMAAELELSMSQLGWHGILLVNYR